jgi:hypothetical protein
LVRRKAPESPLAATVGISVAAALSRFRHPRCGPSGEPNINWTVRFQGLIGSTVLEDAEMLARKGMFSSVGRPVVIAAVAALALSAVAPTAASARPFHRGFGGGAAAAAAFAGVVGTGLAIAASRNGYYDSYDGYYGPAPVYGGPVYYGGGPAYYGPGPGHEYYGGRGDASNVPFTPQTGTW